MGKQKSSKGGDSVPQKHLHSRISFLHQAAAYLSTAGPGISASQRETGHGGSGKSPSPRLPPRPSSAQGRHLLNQLRGVSKKSQIRLGRDVKQSICKRCDSLLISGQTASQRVRNASKGERKPWADIFEVQCIRCKSVKRFPTGRLKDDRSQASDSNPHVGKQQPGATLDDFSQSSEKLK